MAQNDQLLDRDRATPARGGGRPWMLLGAGLVLGVVLTLTLVWWLGRKKDYVNYRYCQVFVRDQIGWKSKCNEALQELRKFEQVDDDLSLEKARDMVGFLFFSKK